MGITGIGVDITKISRIARILTNKSIESRFIEKVLHTREISDYQSKLDEASKAQFVASRCALRGLWCDRWAYKEAVVKAYGRRGLIFNNMYLEKSLEGMDLDSLIGKPFVKFDGKNIVLFGESINNSKVHVSISHEDDTAIAFIIVEE